MKEMLGRCFVSPSRPQFPSTLDVFKVSVHKAPSARHVGTVDAQAPHRQAALSPAERRRYPDRHRLVERFENGDGLGNTVVKHAAD